jgi:hypothetical protein
MDNCFPTGLSGKAGKGNGFKIFLKRGTNTPLKKMNL